MTSKTPWPGLEGEPMADALLPQNLPLGLQVLTRVHDCREIASVRLDLRSPCPKECADEFWKF